jgi:competence protein ComEA
VTTGSPAPQNPVPKNAPRLWLRRSDQFFVGTLLSVGLVLIAIHWVRLSDWGRQTVEVDRLPAGKYQYRVDVNRATWVEWAQFEGIGETLAKRIVADREAHGPFADIDDVQRVRGIGPRKLADMRPYLTIEPAAATANREDSSRKRSHVP